MYKHILAQHSIWRLQEKLKSCLKPWEVLCMKLKEPKCSLLTLFCALMLNFWLQRKTHEVPNWQFLHRFPWRKSSHELCFLHCSVVSDVCSAWGSLFYFPVQRCWNWKANALLDPCIVIHHHLPVPVQSLSTRNAMEQILYVTHQKLLDNCGPSGHSRILGCPAKCCISPRLPGGRISSLAQHHYTVDLMKSLVQGSDAIHCFTADAQGAVLNSKAAPSEQQGSCLPIAETLQELLRK